MAQTTKERFIAGLEITLINFDFTLLKSKVVVLMAEQKEESSKMRRDVEKLIAAIEQNRIHVKNAYEKVENLDAAIQSAKRTHEKLTNSFRDKKAA